MCKNNAQDVTRQRFADLKTLPHFEHKGAEKAGGSFQKNAEQTEKQTSKSRTSRKCQC